MTTAFSAEIVPDISQDSRSVLLSGLSEPLPLSLAVERQFRAVVERENWKEALESIHLSRQGCHGILLMKTGFDPDEVNGIPTLASGALIQKVTEVPDDNDTLLTRDPLFRGRIWKLLADKDTAVKQLERYANKLKRDFNTCLDMDMSRIPDSPGTNEDLEEGIIQAVGAERITELVRLTGDDSNRAGNIYRGLMHFSSLQSEKGIPFSFGVAYETLANTFKILGRRYGEPCFLRLSEHRMKPNEPSTQKFIFFNKTLAEAMNADNWRRIAALVRKTNQDCP